jgi:hypothetical protein
MHSLPSQNADPDHVAHVSASYAVLLTTTVHFEPHMLLLIMLSETFADTAAHEGAAPVWVAGGDEEGDLFLDM